MIALFIWLRAEGKEDTWDSEEDATETEKK
jgi:hypothetical protein